MGEDGSFWFTLSNSSKVARIIPKRQHQLRQDAEPEQSGIHHAGARRQHLVGEARRAKLLRSHRMESSRISVLLFRVSVGITTGSDGNIWFTDQTDHAVWRYELSTGTFTEFPTPTLNSFPGDITTGSDGNMWSPSRQ